VAVPPGDVTADVSSDWPPLEVTSSVVEALPELVLPAVTAWRIEVLRRGKFWQWRERGRRGKSRYGGKFELLSEEKKAQYAATKARRAKAHRLTPHTTRGLAVAGISRELLPTVRSAGEGQQRTLSVHHD